LHCSFQRSYLFINAASLVREWQEYEKHYFRQLGPLNFFLMSF
jgi:hypothetical protein